MREDALILVVDDNDEDAWLLQMAFRRAGIDNPLKVLCDKAEAIEYLSGQGQFADRAAFPVPGIVFTDLNLPQKDGIELLHWMKARPEFAHIPVIVLLGSDDMDEMEAAYAAGARLSLFKPTNYELFVEEVRMVCEDVLLSRSH